jgi:hypothetical protein
MLLVPEGLAQVAPVVLAALAAEASVALSAALLLLLQLSLLSSAADGSAGLVQAVGSCEV